MHAKISLTTYTINELKEVELKKYTRAQSSRFHIKQILRCLTNNTTKKMYYMLSAYRYLVFLIFFFKFITKPNVTFLKNVIGHEITLNLKFHGKQASKLSLPI